MVKYMICYKDSPPFGKFNRFISDACLEEIAAFIQRQVPDHAHEWGLPWITKDNAAAAGLGFIQLNSTRDLFVSGDTLYFRSVFDCRFPKNAEEDPVDADGPLLDVDGKILFYPRIRVRMFPHSGDKEIQIGTIGSSSGLPICRRQRIPRDSFSGSPCEPEPLSGVRF